LLVDLMFLNHCCPLVADARASAGGNDVSQNTNPCDAEHTSASADGPGSNR
jgi:hypothetical protein